MPHVATDNVSAPPAFTCSPFFPLFSYQFIRFTQCSLPQRFGGCIQIFRNFSRVRQWSGRDRRIFAQESDNFSGAKAMFSNFLCAGEERLEYRSVMAPVFSRLWAVPESGRRLGV